MTANLASIFVVIFLAERSWMICGAVTGEPLGHLRITYAGFDLVTSEGETIGRFFSVEEALSSFATVLGLAPTAAQPVVEAKALQSPV